MKGAIGVDIGGINSVVGLVDEDGNIVKELSVSTKKYPHTTDYQAYVTALSDAIKDILDGVGQKYDIEGVGIGAPNANYHRGTIEHPANLWRYADDDELRSQNRIFNLCDDLHSQLPMLYKFAITNDANAAAMGEMVFGNAKGLSDFAMITLGTGLGSGIISNGEMVIGHDGFAGEFGHVIVERGGRECGCGKRGCLECYVSATGIRRTAFEFMANSNLDSPLRDISFRELDSFTIYKLAESGDKLSQDIFTATGEALGRALADLVATTSPSAIFLFGGLAKSGELIFAPARRAMEENLMASAKGNVEILESGIADRNIAVLGAASLVMV